MLRRSSVSSARGVLQRCAAVAVACGVVFTGSVATAAATPTFSHTGALTTSYAVPGPVAQIFMTKPGSPILGFTCSTLALTAGSAVNIAGLGYLTTLDFDTTVPCTHGGYSYSISFGAVNYPPLQYNGTGYYFNIPPRTIRVVGGPGNPIRDFPMSGTTMPWVNPGVVTYSRIQARFNGAGPSADGYSLQLTADWKIQQGANNITALP